MASKQPRSRPEIVLVAAMSRSRVIGHEGGMPWHLPADLQHFKSITLGHPVVMGRRTFESIGRALPGRLNVVVSRARPELPEGVLLANGLDFAIAACAEAERIMVIGGGQIYREAMGLADCLELTLIDADIDGDTYFPQIDTRRWQLRRMQSRPADDRNPHPMRFIRLMRE